MVDFRLLNGKKKVTIIESFNGETLLIFLGGKKGKQGQERFKSLSACKKFIGEHGLEVSSEFLFGSPSSRGDKI